MMRDAWERFRGSAAIRFFGIGPIDLYRGSGPVAAIETPAQANSHFPEALPVLPLKSDVGAIKVGTPSETSGPAIIESIERAASLCMSGEASAMVTNPISKAVLYRSGFSHPGHTEFVASLCNARTGENNHAVMMLVGGGLRVALATIHTPFIEVPSLLSKRHLYELGHSVHKALKQDFGLNAPRLAFAGLNPHAGEDGTIGREEVDIINPAASELRQARIDISDARPGDTVFHEALQGNYDCVIAMTHDQGLIPVKTLDMWGGVNVTLGLPIIRTSPDHGTAYDAAQNGEVRPDSLIAAIELASTMARARQRAHV